LLFNTLLKYCACGVSEKAEAVKDLKERVLMLTTDRDAAIAEALASQNGELEYLKAELASIKVRLRDSLAQKQAEKDALLRHAEADKEDLLRRLAEVTRNNSASDSGSGEMTSNIADAVESATDGSSAKVQDVRSSVSECTVGNLEADTLQCYMNEVENLKQQLAAKTAMLEDSFSKLESHESKLEDLQATFDARVSELSLTMSDQEAEVQRRQERIDQLEEDLKLTRMTEQQIKDDSERVIKLADSERTVLQGELNSLREQLASKSASLDAKESEVSNISERSKVLEAELKLLQLTVNTLKEEKGRAISDEETKLTLVQTELDLLRQELTAKSVDLQMKASEVLQLSEMLKMVEEQNICNIDELQNRDLEIQRFQEELAASKHRFESKLDDIEKGVEDRLEKERAMFRTLLDERTLELDVRSSQVNELEATIRDKKLECDSMKEQLQAEISDLRQQVTRVELDRNVFMEQADSESVELKNRLIKINELEAESKHLKDSLDARNSALENCTRKIHELQTETQLLTDSLNAKNADLENNGRTLKIFEDELNTAKETFSKRCTELESNCDSQLRELREMQRLQIEETVNEIATKNSQIASLVSTIEELRQSAEAERESLLSDVQQKDCDIQILIRKHAQEFNDLTSSFDGQMTKIKAEQHSLNEANSVRITLLENLNHNLTERLASAESSSTEGTLEKITLEKASEDLRVQMENRVCELEDLQRQLTTDIAEKDNEIKVLNDTIAKFGNGWKLVQNAMKRLGTPSDAVNCVGDDVDAMLTDSTWDSFGDDCDFSELVYQIELLAEENKSLHKKVDDFTQDLKCTSLIATTGHFAETSISSLSLQTGAPLAPGIRCMPFLRKCKATLVGMPFACVIDRPNR